MAWRAFCKLVKRLPSEVSSVVSPLIVDWSFCSACMGREAISSARFTEACNVDEKVLVPVVLVCGASVARALLRVLFEVPTELVLMTNLLAK